MTNLRRTARPRPASVAVRIPFALLALCAVAGLAGAFDRGADGEFEKRTSSHFVLYQDVDIDETSGLRGSRKFEQNVLAVLESAYDEADERLGLRPERPITVVVYDPAVFDAQFRGRFRFPVAGFYGGQVHIRGDTVVNDRLVAVLHHEHVHAAFDAEVGRLVLPAWLNEGVAEWFEARVTGRRDLPARHADALRRLAARGQLFALHDLASSSYAGFGPEGAQIAYLQSWAFVDYLADLRGERALRDWIREIARTRDIERATRRTFRRDLTQLHRDHLEALASGA